MNKRITSIATVAAFVAVLAWAPSVRAGQGEWATAGKILTGLVAAQVLLGAPVTTVRETRVVRPAWPRPVCGATVYRQKTWYGGGWVQQRVYTAPACPPPVIYVPAPRPPPVVIYRSGSPCDRGYAPRGRWDTDRRGYDHDRRGYDRHGYDPRGYDPRRYRR